MPVTAESGMEPSEYPARIVAGAIDQDLDMEAASWRRPGARVKLERGAMAGSRIEGAGLRGVMRLTRVEDHLAHVLDHCETDEPSGAWTGLACQDHGLALGGDVDNATLRRLSAHGEIADLIWEPRGELAAEHGQLLQAAILAAQDGKPQTGQQLWQQVRAIWSVAWSANYEALKFLQDAGLSRFSPVKPQRWVVASFEHHRGPHGLPHPHVHNIVITSLTTGAS